jgi:hypothetical protein
VLELVLGRFPDDPELLVVAVEEALAAAAGQMKRRKQQEGAAEPTQAHLAAAKTHSCLGAPGSEKAAAQDGASSAANNDAADVDDAAGARLRAIALGTLCAREPARVAAAAVPELCARLRRSLYGHGLECFTARAFAGAAACFEATLELCEVWVHCRLLAGR